MDQFQESLHERGRDREKCSIPAVWLCEDPRIRPTSLRRGAWPAAATLGASLLKRYLSRHEPAPCTTCTGRNRTQAAMPDSHASLPSTSVDHGRRKSAPSHAPPSPRARTARFPRLSSVASQAAFGSEMALRAEEAGCQKNVRIDSPEQPVQPHCEETYVGEEPRNLRFSPSTPSSEETKPASSISWRRKTWFLKTAAKAHRKPPSVAVEKREPARSTLERASWRRGFHPDKDSITVRSGRASSAPP